MASHRIEEALQRLRAEFLDAPSLSVTPGDVARILAVDPPTARVVLPRPRRRALSGMRAGWTIHPRGATCSASRLCRVWPAARGRLFAPRSEHRRGGGHLGVAGCQHKLIWRIDDEGVQG